MSTSGDKTNVQVPEETSRTQAGIICPPSGDGQCIMRQGNVKTKEADTKG